MRMAMFELLRRELNLLNEWSATLFRRAFRARSELDWWIKNYKYRTQLLSLRFIVCLSTSEE